MTEDLFFEFWIELAQGFGLIEIAITGLCFFLALGAKGKLFGDLFNLMNMPFALYEKKFGVLPKIIRIFQAWLVSMAALLLVALISILFLIYGLVISYSVSWIFEFVGKELLFNRLSATIGISVALFLGNSASVVRALSRRIRWLELGLKYPNDYQKQSEFFKLEQFNQIDFKRDMK